MKVLVVTTSYPDFPGSQRGIFIRKLCRRLAEKGVEPIVLTPRVFARSPWHENDAGVPVYRFRYPSGDRPLHRTGPIPVMPMAIFMISGFLRTLGIIRTHRPDVIHGNWVVPTGLIAALAGWAMHVPVITTAHGMDLRISERQPVRALFDLAVRLSAKTVVVNPSMRERGSLRDAEVIPMGVDERFFDVPPRRDAGAVVYTRSLEPVYDPETLVRSVPPVIEALPGTRFLIAGGGSLKERLEDLARDLGVGDSITFLGHVPEEGIPDLLAGASVFVSTALADGTSPALLEAMAAGLTPVATDIEPNRALVTDGVDGYLFRPGDHGDLARNIVRALSREIPTKALEEKRTRLKEQVSWGIIADRFLSSYNHVLAGSCGRAG